MQYNFTLLNTNSPKAGILKSHTNSIFRLFCAALRWSSPWISTSEPRAQESRTQHSRAHVSRTQELCWIPALIFSAGRRLFDLANLTKERNSAILDPRTGVAPARKLCEHRDQPCRQYSGSRGTCGERSSIRNRDGLDLAPAQIKQSRRIKSAKAFRAHMATKFGQQQGHLSREDIQGDFCPSRRARSHRPLANASAPTQS